MNIITKENMLKNQNIQYLCPMSNSLPITVHTIKSKLFIERTVAELENYRGF